MSNKKSPNLQSHNPSDKDLQLQQIELKKTKLEHEKAKFELEKEKLRFEEEKFEAEQVRSENRIVLIILVVTVGPFFLAMFMLLMSSVLKIIFPDGGAEILLKILEVIPNILEAISNIFK